MRDRGVTYLLLAPAAVIFGTLFVLPLTYFLVISFWRVVLFRLKPDFTFANYLQVFELHLPTLVFTLGLAFLIAVLTTVLGFVYAYLIRFKAGLWGPTLLFVALITLFGGYLMKIYSWMTILGITGVLNTALRALGIIDEPLPWLFYNVGAVVVTLVNFLLPLAILPIYASMRGITDIEMEAARDLGAGGWRRFSDIVVPRSHTGIIGRICPLLPARGRRLPDTAAGRRQGQHDRRADRAAIRRSWQLADGGGHVLRHARILACRHPAFDLSSGAVAATMTGPSDVVWRGIGTLFVVFLLSPLALVVLFAFTSRPAIGVPDRSAVAALVGRHAGQSQFAPGLLEQPDHQRHGRHRLRYRRHHGRPGPGPARSAARATRCRIALPAALCCPRWCWAWRCSASIRAFGFPWARRRSS